MQEITLLTHIRLCHPGYHKTVYNYSRLVNQIPAHRHLCKSYFSDALELLDVVMKKMKIVALFFEA